MHCETQCGGQPQPLHSLLYGLSIPHFIEIGFKQFRVRSLSDDWVVVRMKPKTERGSYKRSDITGLRSSGLLRLTADDSRERNV